MRFYLTTVSLATLLLVAAGSSAQPAGAKAPTVGANPPAGLLKKLQDAGARRKAAKPGEPAPTEPELTARVNAPADNPPGAAAEPPTTMDTLADKIDTPYRPQPGGAQVKFNLEDADLAELVNHISGLTGKRFIYGTKARQIKVTVVSPTPVTIAEAYEAFISILDANGMTVVPHGRFLKIVETAGIANRDTPVLSRGTPVPSTDRTLTRLYRLKHVSPSESIKVLSKFKSKDGDLTPYDEGQLLIMTDTGTQIQRMIRILEEMDLANPASMMWIEPVNYGAATDLAKQLNDLYELGKPGANASGLEKIIGDEQTNSLIIVGSEDSYAKLLELLKRIDTAPALDGRIHVLPLQYADAEELSKTLTRILSGSGGQGAQGGGGGKKGEALSEMFEGDIHITADAPTNSLVVSSSQRDFAQLRIVLEQLDRQRRQLFMEAVIMDVSVDRSTDINLAYHGGAKDPAGDGSILLGGFKPWDSISVPTPNQLNALALGVRGPGIEGSQNLFGISIPAFGVFLNAIANSGDSNVLSTPHLIALDNTPAEISVGENVPLQTNIGGGINPAQLAGAAGGAGAALGGLGLGGFGGFNAQRTDVGTKIKITPHINENNQVRLDIDEEISETGAPVGQLGAVPITKRTAKTTVVVDDQQTVVIGGLVRDSKINSAEKIPVLGDLPVLGVLFRSSKEKMRKTNLLLILTPHVIRDQSDLKRVFERKMQERQEFLDRFFVFNAKWEPPRDYSRTNGLVEVIRQTFTELEERERIEDDLRPSEERTHEASSPLELAAGVKAGAAGGESRPKRRTKIQVDSPSGGKAPRRGGRPRSENNSPLLIQPPLRSVAQVSERSSSSNDLRVE